MKEQLSVNERFLIQELKDEGIKPVFNKKGHLCFKQRHPIMCSKEMIPSYISLVSIVFSIVAIILRLC